MTSGSGLTAGVSTTGRGLLASVTFVDARGEVVVGMSSLTDVEISLGSKT